MAGQEQVNGEQHKFYLLQIPQKRPLYETVLFCSVFFLRLLHNSL